ncbi:MAG: GAF domain-containing protein [Flavobacteriaceae bacterium]
MFINNSHTDFPLQIKISFHKIVDFYKSKLQEPDISPFEKKYIQSLLEFMKPYPKLIEGIEDPKELDKHNQAIEVILNDLFPDILTSNEIKAVTVPFQNFILHPSKRFQNILKAAGPDFDLEIRNFDDNFFFIMSCMLILKTNFGLNIDISRPVYYDIPDDEGVEKHYRVSYNADFVEILANENAVEITQDDIDELLANTENIDLWKEKFPPNSWLFKGFAIVNLTDVTVDNAISELKTTLLNQDKSVSIVSKFQKIFQSLFKINDLRIGLTKFDEKEMELKNFDFLDIPNFILNDNQHKDCKTGLCPSSYEALIKNHDYYVITNVDAYAKRSKSNFLATSLVNNNVKSCILAPIAKGDKLIGVLELVSFRKNELNRINANKLEDVLPYIVTTLERNKEAYENKIKAVIQNECTAIHPSVLWIFEEEAKRFIIESEAGEEASFRDIVFNSVYPLYGQIDIIGSSDIRNKTILKDLMEQLELAESILKKALAENSLAIFEQVNFQISQVKKDIKSNFNASSEQKIVNFMKEEVGPVMNHIQQLSKELSDEVGDYYDLLDAENGVIYNNRKDFDKAILHINMKVAALLDKRQEEAQKIYPHYFERYKTDGVDHNIYIGNSMVKDKAFDKVYLQNLRLWQLQTMCEVENKFYQIQKDSPMQLEASSLILVFNTTLSIRYRMDEKKFDVDGTYNARYEIIKKRIDKAFIKNTEERITQKGKIVIVYSHKDDEKEYKKYINFLQSKNVLGKKVETLDVEDLQGVVGLKALRVEVLYHDGRSKQHYSYDDLMKEIVAK